MRLVAVRARIAIAAAAIIASACARSTAVAQTKPPQPAARTMPNDLRWFRTSAEYRALARQAYQVAGDRLSELSRGLAAGSWAVILDVDESILDNSEYERRLFATNRSYTDSSWATWVNERAAPAIPGSVEFTRRIHELGGRVAIVTNRADMFCAATRANLESVGVHPDVMLCQPPGESDKNPRFDKIAQGTAAAGVPPLTVVAWVGDNIMDFPHLTQSARNDPLALSDFGKRYFILPNPIYGSWQNNRDP